ncbi:hypothetical protein DSO57_1025029 [Entomophthora muscae]|uniref:Uncharacterized protein n=1 Tax=Entomophthora muscae TaxID=34485 RepID=A0ACC2UMY8_9FUNG|nr:hypothetical protein DSO57_1025029 [Entomophthora muscae]
MFINSSVFKIIHDSLEEFGYQNVLHELKGVLMGSKAAGAETIEKVALLSLQLALDNPQYSDSTLPELELLAKAYIFSQEARDMFQLILWKKADSLLHSNNTEAEKIYYLCIEIFDFDALSNRNKAALLWYLSILML